MTGTALSPSPVAAAPARARLESIDLVRGAVMVIMVLDHTRDYVHNVAFTFDPTDLTQTTTLLFLTRWVTHFCAPTFVFLAGVAAYLQRARGATTAELSRFLLTRGLWLVVLEFTVVRVGTWFNLDYGFLGVMQVIWAIGVSMVVLAGLVHLPIAAIASFGVAMIALHNLFDGIHVQSWQGPGSPVPGAAARLWMILHQGNEFFPLFTWPGPVVFLIYPLVPWIGVMAAGYAFGRVYDLDAAQRRRALALTGAALVVGVHRPSRAEHLWRSGAMAGTAVSTLHAAVVRQHDEISAVAPVPADDAGSDDARARVARRPARSPAAPGARLSCSGGCRCSSIYCSGRSRTAWRSPSACFAGKDVGYYFISPPAFFTEAPPNAGFELWVVYACWAARRRRCSISSAAGTRTSSDATHVALLALSLS